MDDTAIIDPTSTATTQQTEPEVVAGISSAEGSPNLPLAIRAGSIRAGDADFGIGRTLLLFGAGLAVGYGAYHLWQVRGRYFFTSE